VSREIKIKYFYSDGHKIFNRVFTLQEIEQELQFDEICDSPLLKDFKIIHRFQYTGLDDKNDVEIYEGDIVKSTFSYRGQEDKKVCVVEWDAINPCFVLLNIDNKNDLEYDFVQVNLRTNKVIGNIYENPELLEAKS